MKHTKLDNIRYEKLEIQGYLSNQEISVTQAKILLKYRTGMAEYRSNYGATEDCKLCEKHLDSQDKIFDCEFIRKSSKISMKYDDLFTPNVEVETVRNLEEIHKLRENKLK